MFALAFYSAVCMTTGCKCLLIRRLPSRLCTHDMGCAPGELPSSGDMAPFVSKDAPCR